MPGSWLVVGYDGAAPSRGARRVPEARVPLVAVPPQAVRAPEREEVA